MKQEEINKNWSESSTNYDRIIQDELQSFRVEAWQEQILSHFDEKSRLKILDLAVQSLRAQGDKITYPKEMLKTTIQMQKFLK